MRTVLLVLVVLAAIGVAVVANRRTQQRELERSEAALAPVRRMASEDITALGEQLQALDTEMAGRQLDAGANADYQRALDDYEAAKSAADALQRPEDVRGVTEIVEDGRYAMACVRARVEGRALPPRRPPCFFDPRHGLSEVDVDWRTPAGDVREVPACALDAERVRQGAEPDVRKVMVGSQRVPYWAGGSAYQPYAAGYFGAFAPMNWMFMGMMFGGFGGFGGFGDGMGEGADGMGDGGDLGGGDGFGGFGDGAGGFGDFGGFDF